VITQIDHIEIIVKDVKEYVEFYQKLGFKLLQWTDHHGGAAELQLPGPNQPIFEIHTVIDEENIGINHIAFKTDDLVETYDLNSRLFIPMREILPPCTRKGASVSLLFPLCDDAFRSDQSVRRYPVRPAVPEACAV